MSCARVRQHIATPARLKSSARHAPIARARRWCWYFLYCHPYSQGTSAALISEFYQRDPTTVLHGIDKIKYSVKTWPEQSEALLLGEIAAEIMPEYGAFSIGQERKKMLHD